MHRQDGSTIVRNTVVRHSIIRFVMMGILVLVPVLAQAGTPSPELNVPGDNQSAKAPLGGGDVLYDRETDVAISVALAPDGAIALSASGGGLQFTKRVYSDGRFEIDLHHRGDWVGVWADRGYVRVARRRGAVGFAPSDGGEASYQHVRGLLADSSAVRQFRNVVSSLDEATLATAAGVGLLIADAQVGLLDGDVGAIARLAPVLAGQEGIVVPRGVPQEASRRASAGGNNLPAGQSCYMRWQDEVVASWNDLDACLNSFSTWNPTRHLCNYAWMLRVDAAWFELMSCLAFPWGR